LLFCALRGLDFEVLECLAQSNAKPDLASVQIGGKVIPVYLSGNPAKLDACLGLGTDHHEDAPAEVAGRTRPADTRLIELARVSAM
jgi:hypothetical protein